MDGEIFVVFLLSKLCIDVRDTAHLRVALVKDYGDVEVAGTATLYLVQIVIEVTLINRYTALLRHVLIQDIMEGIIAIQIILIDRLKRILGLEGHVNLLYDIFLGDLIGD